jgi:hypothetical protein
MTFTFTTPIVILTIFLSEGQAGNSKEFSKQCSDGYREALGKKKILQTIFAFKDK